MPNLDKARNEIAAAYVKFIQKSVAVQDKYGLSEDDGAYVLLTAIEKATKQLNQ